MRWYDDKEIVSFEFVKIFYVCFWFDLNEKKKSNLTIISKYDLKLKFTSLGLFRLLLLVTIFIL